MIIAVIANFSNTVAQSDVSMRCSRVPDRGSKIRGLIVVAMVELPQTMVPVPINGLLRGLGLDGIAAIAVVASARGGQAPLARQDPPESLISVRLQATLGSVYVRNFVHKGLKQLCLERTRQRACRLALRTKLRKMRFSQRHGRSAGITFARHLELSD